jgi:hypothetical protein
MAITIDGTAGTISGLVAGGLPSGSVTSATIADATIASGDIASGVVPAGGKVLQVVSSTSTAYVVTTSMTYIATGLSASITPSSTSSKILVQVTGHLDTTNPSYIIQCQIYKNGSSDTGILTATYNQGSRLMESCAFNHMSSPATTSSTTYEVYFHTPANNNEVRWNSQNTVCSMVLMEIAG